MIVFIKKILGVKAKKKLTFLSFFDNPLSKYFTFKNLSSMYWLFWAIYQRSMGLVFVHMFCILFARYVPYITLYPPVKFQHQIFFISQGINEHEFLITVLSNDDVINFKIYFWSLSFPMADRVEKGEEGITKIWIIQEWKELFKWNKRHFSWILQDLLVE